MVSYFIVGNSIKFFSYWESQLSSLGDGTMYNLKESCLGKYRMFRSRNQVLTFLLIHPPGLTLPFMFFLPYGSLHEVNWTDFLWYYISTRCYYFTCIIANIIYCISFYDIITVVHSCIRLNISFDSLISNSTTDIRK